MEDNKKQERVFEEQIQKLTPANGNSELLIKLFEEKDAIITEQKAQIKALTTEVEILGVLNDDLLALSKKMSARIKQLHDVDNLFI